jgi:DNA-binding XRE family transcriptional regulator
MPEGEATTMGLTKAERARIEAKGGVITTVKDFLGLDDLDMQIIETRIRIGREVKRRREAASLSQGELAERMGVSRTRIPTIEDGGKSSLDAVVSAFFATGGGLDELGAVIAGKV